jgi:signal transduction histidine kinase
MMLLIGFSWRTATHAITETQRQQVDIRAQFVESNISQRIDVYNSIVSSGVALFGSSTDVTRDEWRNFVSAQRVSERLPGLLGLGYAEVVTHENKTAFESRQQQEGLPVYQIFPAEPPRPVYVPVRYLEPMSERNRQIISGDIYYESLRQQAIDKARDTGEITMTDAVDMLLDDGTRANGITIFQPIYKRGVPASTETERRAAMTGVVYAPLAPSKFFGSIFQDEDTNFNFKIFDGDELNENTLLYERYPHASDGEPYTFIKETKVTVDDQHWTIRYSARSGIVPQSLRDRPNSIAVGGIIFALLVAGIVYLLLQRRSRKVADNENRKLERAKDSMLSLASHQLRTPATGVKQYLGMVLEGFVGDLSDDQKELLKKANDSNERQLRIINEFLYLAKADAERVVISPQRFDLGELTRSVVADMQSDVVQAGHTLSTRIRQKAIPVLADVHSARMILENLISNAIKYTPPGGKIKVTAFKHKTGGMVSVEDNGVGIDKKDMKKLFLQFSRIPNELTRQETGSGIGLYLAKYLTELNGGKIEVESKRHVGSTFSVYFTNKNVKNITVRENK